MPMADAVKHGSDERVTRGDVEELKRRAGREAAAMVQDGTVIGLGSGSTAREFVRALGERVADGLNVRAVASSRQTAKLACEMGITVVDLAQPLDLAVDGADAVDRSTLAAIKGLGGALVREKLVARAAVRFVLVIDDSKLYDHLADSQPQIPVPVEVLPFGWKLTQQRLQGLGNAVIRTGDDGKPFVSDNGNLILDLYGCEYGNLLDLGARIKQISGVVDHGLFFNLVTDAIVASPEGIRTLSAE